MDLRVFRAPIFAPSTTDDNVALQKTHDFDVRCSAVNVLASGDGEPLRCPDMPPRAASSDDTDTAFTLALAQAGSAAILPWFRTSVSIENKDAGGFDPVTEADRAAEQAMRTMIEETYPDDGIDGEEFGIKPSRSEGAGFSIPSTGPAPSSAAFRRG